MAANGYWSYEWNDKLRIAESKIMAAVEILDDRYDRFGRAFVDWNNDPARTQAEVLAAFYTAAELARKEEAVTA